MGNFEDLKQIWLSEKAEDLPSAEEMRKLVSAEKNLHRRKILFSIFAVVILLVFMALIMFFFEAKLLSTLLGEALMLAAISILLVSRINSLRRSLRNENISNREFIGKLKADIERLTNDWNTVQKTGFAFIGAGYLLFLYETVYQNRTTLMIGYSLTIVFLLAVWFFLRPFANRRKLEKKEILLKKIENLLRQIKE